MMSLAASAAPAPIFANAQTQKPVAMTTTTTATAPAKRAFLPLPLVGYTKADDKTYHCVVDEILDQRYRVNGFIQEGGCARVYRAWDEKDPMRREVAIKIHSALKHIEEAFQRETQSLSVFASVADRHHLMSSLGHFTLASGHFCVVMPLYGQSLAGALAERQRFLGQAPLCDSIRRIGCQIARALIAATKRMASHYSVAGPVQGRFRAKAYVHGDLKPQNIMMERPGSSDIRVTDFGNCSRPGDYLWGSQTMQYRAPEVMLDYPTGPPMDMWSFGCILFEIATGKLLFGGTNHCSQLVLHYLVTGNPCPVVYMQDKTIGLPTLKNHPTLDQAMKVARTWVPSNGQSNTGIRFDKMPVLEVKELLASNHLHGIVPCALGSTQKNVGICQKTIPQLIDDLAPPSFSVLYGQYFCDLLARCFEFDPSKRITPEEALLHPFLKETAMEFSIKDISRSIPKPVSAPTTKSPLPTLSVPKPKSSSSSSSSSPASLFTQLSSLPGPSTPSIGISGAAIMTHSATKPNAQVAAIVSADVAAAASHAMQISLSPESKMIISAKPPQTPPPSTSKKTSNAMVPTDSELMPPPPPRKPKQTLMHNTQHPSLYRPRTMITQTH